MAKNQLSFEQALQRVEQIVEAIEQGRVGLEDSIKQYEEGMRLLALCRSILADAELKIQKLHPTPEGDLRAEPFESADAAEADAPPAADDQGAAPPA